MVDRHFNYLTEKYGFSQEDQQYNAEAFGNAHIQLRSINLDLRISLDRGIVLVNFKPLSKFPDWFDLQSTVEFLNSNIDEPVYIFPEDWSNYDNMVDKQMQRVSRVVKQYCEPVLSGQFSKWKKVEKLRMKKVKRDYKNITGKNYPL